MNPYKGKFYPDGSDELIPSRSNFTESSASVSDKIYDINDYFPDPIHDEGLADSDHPSETYKNSLELPHGSSRGSSQNKYDRKMTSKYESYELSKSIGFNTLGPGTKTLADKAS